MTDADTERKAIVAWLRALADTVEVQSETATDHMRGLRMLCAETYRATAGMIENGEHLFLLNPEVNNAG